MKIKKVEISNIKGIGNYTFDLDVIPNKPIVLVAPNGFGKTSFSIAFDSIHESKLVLDKDNFHKNDQNLPPVLRIEYEDAGAIQSVHADNTSNSIKSKFQTFVINSKLKATAKILNINGTRIAKSSMEIEPTVLIATIPQKVTFNYSFAEQKRAFGTNGKILANIKGLLACAKFLISIKTSVNFTKFTQIGFNKKLTDITTRINAQPGTGDAIKAWISATLVSEVATMPELWVLCELATTFGKDNISTFSDALSAAFQIIYLHKTLARNFNKAVDYAVYLSEKSDYAALLKSVNSTRHAISPIEDGKKLVIKWPKAHEISNGQRDVLSFIALLMKARRSLDAENNVLIIDEIFDYLDDANLVTFQYFITTLIDEIKTAGKNIFPIMLTHLDPNHFQHFCFNRHKMQIRYLKTITSSPNVNIVNLIKKRDDPTVKSALDLHFFHFHPQPKDLSAEFSALELYPGIGLSNSFYAYVRGEATKYLSGNVNFCPFSVCFSLRIRIEEYLYRLIQDPTKEAQFIAIHGTKNKIDYCVSIPLQTCQAFRK